MAAPTLFVTGMQRSGTTLLDRLLDAHPRLSVLSQPLPLLFVRMREIFLQRCGVAAQPYPLGPMFREATTAPQFEAFLENHPMPLEEAAACFERMRGYSGQYFRPDDATVSRLLADWPDAPFARQLEACYASLASRPGARWRGGKETLCEAFVPLLLRRGWRVVLVLRDPRDVLASLNHGAGAQWAGAPKPTLFNLRHWRKSVALALAFASHPGLAVVRYEELLRAPERALATLASFLGIEAFDEEVWRSRLAAWRGNSSFGEHAGLARDGAGQYRNRLSPQVIEFVEAACHAELRVLGYETALPRERIESVLRGFVDPYAGARPGWPDFGAPSQIDAELERLQSMQRISGDELGDFVFPGARRALALERERGGACA